MTPPPNVVALGFVNKIPPGLTADEASLSEILACCLNAQTQCRVQEGDVVLVIGAGPAGCVQLRLAQLQGAAKTLIAQRSPARLALARRFHPDRVIATQEEDLAQIVRDETDGVGADVIYVCAPSRAAQEQALQILAPAGRINFFGGLPKDDCTLALNANVLHYLEQVVTGASSSLPAGNRQALELLATGEIAADQLITHRFPLAEITQAFATAEGHEALKVVVNP
jgi:L-iditol 2-dehydrogenase